MLRLKIKKLEENLGFRKGSKFIHKNDEELIYTISDIRRKDDRIDLTWKYKYDRTLSNTDWSLNEAKDNFRDKLWILKHI